MGAKDYTSLAKGPWFHRTAVIADTVNQCEQLQTYTDEDEMFYRVSTLHTLHKQAWRNRFAVNDLDFKPSQ